VFSQHEIWKLVLLSPLASPAHLDPCLIRQCLQQKRHQILTSVTREFLEKPSFEMKRSERRHHCRNWNLLCPKFSHYVLLFANLDRTKPNETRAKFMCFQRHQTMNKSGPETVMLNADAVYVTLHITLHLPNSCKPGLQ